MNGERLVLLTATLLLWASAARANDWYHAATSQAGTRYFLDKESIARTEATVKVDVFAVFQRPNTSGAVGYTNTTEYACNRNQSKILRTSYLNPDGSVKQTGAETRWSEVAVGTIDEVLFKEACSYR